MADAGHEHTAYCADRSRYALIRVQVVLAARGRSTVNVYMKPSGACWTDLERVATVPVEGPQQGLPRSEEEAVEVAVTALRAAYPGLF